MTLMMRFETAGRCLISGARPFIVARTTVTSLLKLDAVTLIVWKFPRHTLSLPGTRSIPGQASPMLQPRDLAVG